MSTEKSESVYVLHTKTMVKVMLEKIITFKKLFTYSSTLVGDFSQTPRTPLRPISSLFSRLASIIYINYKNINSKSHKRQT